MNTTTVSTDALVALRDAVLTLREIDRDDEEGRRTFHAAMHVADLVDDLLTTAPPQLQPREHTSWMAVLTSEQMTALTADGDA